MHPLSRGLSYCTRALRISSTHLQLQTTASRYHHYEIARRYLNPSATNHHLTSTMGQRQVRLYSSKSSAEIRGIMNFPSKTDMIFTPSESIQAEIDEMMSMGVQCAGSPQIPDEVIRECDRRFGCYGVKIMKLRHELEVYKVEYCRDLANLIENEESLTLATIYIRAMRMDNALNLTAWNRCISKAVQDYLFPTFAKDSVQD